jgi:hypothetical protein
MVAMLERFDTVVLTRDVPEARLRSGDIGAIVDDDGSGRYEVRFVAGGRTVAVVELTDADVRRLADAEILHV